MIIKSIRFRLLLWLAFLLVCTLTGFALATFEAHRIKTYRQVDEQLGRRIEFLARMARGPNPPWGRGFNDRLRPEPRPNPPDALPLPGEPLPDLPGERFRDGGHRRRGEPGPLPNFERARQEDELLGIYFAIWERDGTPLDASTNAPPDLVRPTQEQPPDSGPHFYTRGLYREAYDYNREGRCVLMGRSIEAELQSMRGFAVILTVAGLAVLALSLGGGWLLVGRAIRPVETISATARRIAEGNLAERINVTDTESELGQLAGTLNSTFARLEASFTQQKQFTADASHELRTPLAVIISEAQTTLARERTPSEYRETIQACLDTAQQMRRLTESLLELAKLDASPQSVKHERLDLAELARHRMDFIRPLAEQHGLRLTGAFSAASTSGNPEHLGLVINNLLSNAIHYNQPNGQIIVTTGVDSGRAFVKVADTGRGIEPGDLPLIFDRFYRADKSRSRAEGRSGLGLAICKTIVDAHGGSIEVVSEVEVGSTFTVRLPS